MVLVTAPDVKTARAIARAAIEARMAACANLIPRVESIYWWRDKVEKGKETLLLFKTRRRLLGSLERLVLTHHPYDTPEFVVLSLVTGNRRYLQWLAGSVQPRRRQSPDRLVQ